MNNRVFYNWVPKKLDVYLLLLLSIMLSFNSGIPSTVAGYVVGSQSALAADLSMASFAYFSGMACALPLTLRLMQFTNRKLILCLIFPVLIFLNFLLSVTDQPLILVMVSFVIGFLKMIATLVVVLSLIPILMPKGERYQLYCLYYPLSLAFGPVAGVIAASLANHYNWEISIHAQNVFLFSGLLLIIYLVHPDRSHRKIPLYQYDWIGTLLYAIGMLLASYVVAYGLTEDWFNSFKIQMATAGAAISFVLFIRNSVTTKRPLFSFVFFRFWKPMLGLTLLLIFCLFFNTSSLISPFLNIILRNNPVESATINTFVIPGYIAGAILCFLYYRRFTNFNIPAAVACACYLASNLLMYRLTSSYTDPASLFLPMFLRALATVTTYISVGIYMTTNIPVQFLNDLTIFIILVRSLLAPLLAAAIYGNWLYSGSIRHLNMLADNMDRLNPYVTARGAGVFSSVRNQASLLAIRDAYGILIVAGIVLLVFIIVFPFHGSHKRTIFNWQNPQIGKEIAQSITV
jgi:DHA2 family multidrug resistance protein